MTRSSGPHARPVLSPILRGSGERQIEASRKQQQRWRSALHAILEKAMALDQVQLLLLRFHLALGLLGLVRRSLFLGHRGSAGRAGGGDRRKHQPADRESRGELSKA